MDLETLDSPEYRRRWFLSWAGLGLGVAAFFSFIFFVMGAYADELWLLFPGSLVTLCLGKSDEVSWYIVTIVWIVAALLNASVYAAVGACVYVARFLWITRP